MSEHSHKLESKIRANKIHKNQSSIITEIGKTCTLYRLSHNWHVTNGQIKCKCNFMQLFTCATIFLLNAFRVCCLLNAHTAIPEKSESFSFLLNQSFQLGPRPPKENIWKKLGAGFCRLYTLPITQQTAPKHWLMARTEANDPREIHPTMNFALNLNTVQNCSYFGKNIINMLVPMKISVVAVQRHYKYRPTSWYATICVSNLWETVSNLVSWKCKTLLALKTTCHANDLLCSLCIHT